MQMGMPTYSLCIVALQADIGDLLSLFGIQDAAQSGQLQATPVIGEQRKRLPRRLKALQKQ